MTTKKWRDTVRDGRPVRIYATDGAERFVIHGAIKCEDGWRLQTWKPSGAASSSYMDDDRDLIEIHPEPTYRPFTKDELPRIVGRRVRRIDHTDRIRVVMGIEDGTAMIPAEGQHYPRRLLDFWEFLDYDSDGQEVVSPCGVLEGGER